MLNWDTVTRHHVLAAVAECDELGRDGFLDRYGFGPARGYVLKLDGRGYDSKAILGAAHRHATGRAAGADEFSGGKSGAALILRRLGFEVTGPKEVSGS